MWLGRTGHGGDGAANIGDARTVLDNHGKPLQLSKDAVPTDPRFAKSIENRGGTVLLDPDDGSYRVSGMIAPARAFGDLAVPGMSCRPKIVRVPLSKIKKGSRLILACDGIWDVASTRQVVAASHLAKSKKIPLKKLARTVVQSAYKADSSDNLTTLVVDIA